MKKLLTALISGAIVLTLFGTAIAAESIIPNFTALKIGEPATDPADGEIATVGKILSESNITANTFLRSNLLKVNTLMPTAVTIGIAGDLDVTGTVDVTSNLNVDGAIDTDSNLFVTGSVEIDEHLTVEGDLEARTFGEYYSVLESCDQNSCDYDSPYYTLDASCEEGDYALFCGYAASSFVEILQLVIVEGATQYCHAELANSLNGTFNLQTICLDPDGSTGGGFGGYWELGMEMINR